jgi:endonuclease YncB( thermonuclease family)
LTGNQDQSPFRPNAVPSVRRMFCFLALVLPIAGEATSSAAEQPTITRSARVIDADTLDFGSTRIRLFGSDAPESAQEGKDPKGGT